MSGWMHMYACISDIIYTASYYYYCNPCTYAGQPQVANAKVMQL